MSEDRGPGMATWMIWVVGLAIVIITLLTITAIWFGAPEVGLGSDAVRSWSWLGLGSPMVGCRA